MRKIEKSWFNDGYHNNQHGEHPEAFCQKEWGEFLTKCCERENPFIFLVKHFPFYKQGATKAYNEKNK